MTAAQLETLSNTFPELRQLVGEIIKYLVDNPGGGGVTLYTGDGTLAGDRTVDLDGKSFNIIENSIPFLQLDPAGFGSSLKITDGVSDVHVALSGNVGGGNVLFEIRANDGTNQVNIEGDAVANTLIYTAGKHKFDNLQDFADNAAALLGGLTAGMLYYTDVAGDGILKVVI